MVGALWTHFPFTLSKSSSIDSEDAMSQKTIYHNGKIATNSTPYFVEAMAVEDGKVLATGTSSNLLQNREAGTRLVDLGGHTVIPGLNDSHMHVIRGGCTITWSFAGMAFHP